MVIFWWSGSMIELQEYRPAKSVKGISGMVAGQSQILFDGEKLIIVMRDGVAFADYEDYDKIKGVTWYVRKLHKVNYAWYGGSDSKSRGVMHRIVVDYNIVDHKNGDGLDNRKSNLRPCTQSTNGMNRGVPANNSTGYKGVSYVKRTGKYHAYINSKRKRKFLGYYDTAEKAYEAYLAAVKDTHGEFARLF
jgi:hypothetical protein